MSISGVACQAIAWRRLPLDQYLTEAHGAGYEGSELTSWQAAQWARESNNLRTDLERAGLPLVALYHSARLCCSDGLEAEFQESARAARVAQSLGARFLVMGNPPKHRVHSDSGLGVLQSTLNRLGEVCARMDITLVYQPHYGGPVQTPEEVDDLMYGTDPELVSLCLDTAHIAWGGGHPAALMMQWGRRVRYIQLKDLRATSPGWGERLAWLVHYARLGSLRGYVRGLYPLQQGLRAVSSAMFTVPGKGCLDFRAFRGAMESAGYKGWLTVEIDSPSLDPGRAMADGLEYIRSTFDLSKMPKHNNHDKGSQPTFFQIQDILLQDSAHLADELTLPLSSARIEVQCLLQHVLNVSRAWLLAHSEYCLNQPDQTRYDELLQRRLAGEPIAYILGEREFFGLNFKVTPATLIPRPETELLVELALQRIPEKTPSPQPSPGGRESNFRVLDLGTGSGAIALAIAHSRPNACVLGCDASSSALEVARENAQRLDITNAAFLQSDWYEALGTQRFDLIVSNPPYVASGDPHLLQGDLRFEPASALASGADGLQDIRRIVAEAPAHLQPGGWLLLEHGYDQAERVRELFQQASFSAVFSACDLAGIERVSGGRIALAENTPFMDNPRP